MRTRLVRTGNGQTIHQFDCRQLLNPRTRQHPWQWAENKTRDQIEDALAAGLGLRLCKTCNPLDGWKGPFHACQFRQGCDCGQRCEAYELHLRHGCCVSRPTSDRNDPPLAGQGPPAAD